MMGAILLASFFQPEAPLQPFSDMRSYSASPTVGAAVTSEGRVEMRGVGAFQRHHDNAGAQLRHAEIRGQKLLPPDLIILPPEPRLSMRVRVVIEGRSEHAPDIFKHDGSGLNDFRDLNAAREKIALVLFAELLARD